MANKSTTPKLRKKIFLCGAELMADNDGPSSLHGACAALRDANVKLGSGDWTYESEYHQFFGLVFNSKQRHFSHYFGPYRIDRLTPCREASRQLAQQARVIALLLCAELIADGFTAEDFK